MGRHGNGKSSKPSKRFLFLAASIAEIKIAVLAFSTPPFVSLLDRFGLYYTCSFSLLVAAECDQEITGWADILSDFQTNILPFSILREQTEVSFSSEEKEGYFRIHKNNLPKNIPGDFKNKIEKFAWWASQLGEDDTVISVNLFDNKRFAKHYFNKILFDHFQNQHLLTNRNFIQDTEVYLEDTSFHNNDYKRNVGFALRIDDNDLIQGTSLLVSYEGVSYVLKRSLAELKLDRSCLGKVIYRGAITRPKDLSEGDWNDVQSIYPIINRDIQSALNLSIGRNFSENKCKKYYDEINQFYELHLKDVVVGDCIKIVGSGFYRPYEAKVKQTSENSNLLLFGNNRKHFVPYTGIKEYGPIEGLPPDQPIRFIFIFHKDDKDFANKVYSYFKKGYKSFPGLESFVKIKFETDSARAIRFASHNPFEEIKSALEKTQFEANTRYAALYISRIKKDGEDQEDDEIYYKLKELLLRYNIVSQVIYKENIGNPAFNFYLPNIAIALLAKLGGIPWRLYRLIKNDLVVGVGADRSTLAKNHFVGNAICFRNDGRFTGFNAYEKGDTEALANSLREAIEQYTRENTGVERLVIHYYKKMSQREEEPIRAVLNHLNLSVPYVVVTITESEDYVLFDTSFDGKMPQSGTFIKTKWNEFLLCNNTRYSKDTGTRIDGFPLPIKVKFQSSNYEKIGDMDAIGELIDQVYQFSRMYWKSVRQRSMPVTIEYSEILARMISHFENKELGSFARNSLWFL